MIKHKYIVITGMDGVGKTTLKNNLSKKYNLFSFKSPYFEFVRDGLKISGNGKPFVDNYTDILLFMTDHRLTQYKIREWIMKNNIVSQRGIMDIFIFNKIININYNSTYKLLKLDKIEPPILSIYLIAEPKVAYNRIKNDLYKDKFEVLDFINKQYKEVLFFYKNINKNKNLKKLFTEDKILMDTTKLTTKETFDKVVEIIESKKIFN